MPEFNNKLRISILIPFLSLFLNTLIFSQIPKKHENIFKEQFGLKLNASTNSESYKNYKGCNSCLAEESTTLLNDTTGLIFNNEYVHFRDPIYYQNFNPIASFVNSAFISVNEFKEFQKYVQDSLLRELVISNLMNKEILLNMVIQKKKGEDIRKLEIDQIRVNSNLNWEYKISKTDTIANEILNELYLPAHERYYWIKTIDERKLSFNFDFLIPSIKNNVENNFYKKLVDKQMCYIENNNAIIENRTNISIDFFTWAINAKTNFDINSALANTYEFLGNGKPIIGLNGTQVLAFCKWKEMNLQKQINNLKLPYIIQITLPNEKDIEKYNLNKNYEISEFDFTTQWKITNKQYLEFVNYVIDSIAIEQMYYDENTSDDDASTLLKHTSKHFTNAGNNYFHFDTSQRWSNRDQYNFNYNIIGRLKSEFNKIKNNLMNNDSITLKYLYKNNIFKSTKGKYIYYSEWGSFDLDVENSQFVGLKGEYSDPIWKTSDTSFAGEDLNLEGNINCLGHSKGVRSSADLSRYYLYESINILPEGFDLKQSNPNEMVNNLLYNQAMAYYFWKSKSWAFQNAKKLTDYVFPTEQEFKEIQEGKKVVMKKHSINYPTPIARYVIHLSNK